MSTVSLSKGVFAFKRSRNTFNVKGHISQFWRHEEDYQECRSLTYENYKKCLSLSNEVIKDLMNEAHSKVFEDMIGYIKRVGCSKCFSLFEETNTSKDIPVACLVTGVNMPDHATLFNHLTSVIKENVTPYVSRLTSSDMQQLKTTIFKLVSSIINKDEEAFLSDSDTEDLIVNNSSPKRKPCLQKSRCHMSSLAMWYKEHVVNNNGVTSPLKSPMKKRKSNSPRKKMHKIENENKKSELSPVIVIIEEIETVPIGILQDIILIASEYHNRIPFVFVFGVSTTPSYIHRHLSYEASSFITMETFQAQPSSSLLSDVIDKILINSSIPFHVGGKIFKLLMDIFLFHDLSVKNFVSGLQFCMLEHFCYGKGSFLCCDKNKREKILSSVEPDLIGTLRELPSFKNYINGLNEMERKAFEDDVKFCKFVSESLIDLENWYTSFCILIKVLHCFVSSLPGMPLGRQVRELFSICLSQQVSETEEFQNAWKLFGMSSKPEMLPKLEKAITTLEENKENPEVKNVLSKLKDFYFEMNKEEVMDYIEKEKPASPILDLKPSDRFNLREKLLGHQKSRIPKTKFEELRTEVLTFFEHIFITNLKPYHSKLFHEVFFFDAIGSVKYQLLGSVRATVQTGLTDPHKYLQCNCCKLDEKDSLVTSLPDLSLCYKLHLECGKFINLFDWLQAFLAVVGDEEEESAGSNNRKRKINEVLQARFIQAVAELQLLGFIKPTKKKTDHVQRLTWGGC